MTRAFRVAGAAAALLVAVALPAYAQDIDGDKDPNFLKGTPQADVIHGKGAADVIQGKGGPDEIYGDKGADQLYGNGGRDIIVTRGHDGPNTLSGGRGHDKLYPRGQDEVLGGLGNDRIEAAYPDPAMIVDCGPGNDTLIFNEAHPGVAITNCEHVKIVSAG